MRFTDFLKATVLISAAAATTLAVVTVAGAQADDQSKLVFVAAGWDRRAAAILAKLTKR